MEEEAPRNSGEIAIGADLSALSLDDLEERITLLMAEIERIRADMERKRRSLNAADGFFKT